MINGVLNEHINKNNVLVDESNVLDVYCIDMLYGQNAFKIRPSSKKFGYIYIEINGLEEEIVVKYAGVCLKKIVSSGEYIFPITFIKNKSLEISGACTKILLKVYGSKFEYKKNSTLLPLNKLIMFGVNNKCLYGFQGSDSIIFEEFEKKEDISEKNYVQTFIQNNEIGLGKLDFNRGLKFSNSFNNYASSIDVLSDVVQDAIFIQDNSRKNICFVYLKDNMVYYKQYNLLTSELSDESQLILNSGVVLSLVSSSVNTFNSKFFGVVLDNGICVYVIKNNLQIQKVYESKSENLRIYEFDDYVKFVLFDKYTIKLVEFGYDITKTGSSILQYKNLISNSNVIDLLEYNGVNIYTSICGCKGLISE